MEGESPRRLESWHLLLLGVALFGFGLLNVLGLLEPRSGPATQMIVLGRLGWTPTLLFIAAGAWLLYKAHRVA